MPDTDTRSVWDVAAADITPATSGNMAQRAGALNALRLLGIDPAMDVETLRRRLLWGERVEQWFHDDFPVPFGREYPGGEFGFEGDRWAEGVDDAMNWIDRPEES